MGEVFVRYKLHRIAPNSNHWEGPSIGRLGQPRVGDYVHENGFGHEDWNFAFTLAHHGIMIGYTVARPGRGDPDETFGLILATHDADGWCAVGYYEEAEYVAPPNIDVPDEAVARMAADIYWLASEKQTHPRLGNMTLAQIEDLVRKDFIYFCWRVPEENVHVFREPRPIPTSLFNPGRQRMMTSNNLTEDQFLGIVASGDDVAAPMREREKLDEREVEEGARVSRVHTRIERDAKLVRDFKASLASFACEACGFDFRKAYGELGSRFIECHHTKPVSTMKPGDTTKQHELSGLCSNCHRMIHRSKPMLTPEQLRDVIAAARS